MTKLDPTRDAPQRAPTGDSELDEMLAGIERVSEMGLAQNAQMLDGHLRGSDQVIANVAALRTIHEGGVLLEAVARAAQNPT